MAAPFAVIRLLFSCFFFKLQCVFQFEPVFKPLIKVIDIVNCAKSMNFLPICILQKANNHVKACTLYDMYFECFDLSITTNWR